MGAVRPEARPAAPEVGPPTCWSGPAIDLIRHLRPGLEDPAMKAASAGLPTNTPRLVAAYGVAVLATFALFFVIRGFGEGLVAPAAGQGRPPLPAARVHVLMHVLLALLTIIIACRVVGSVFGRFGQPPVIGEIVAG